MDTDDVVSTAAEIKAAELAVLEDLAANDKLTSEELVAVSVDPAAPLHARFEWNDEAAGHLHRVAQAGQIIRNVRVTIEPSVASEPIPLSSLNVRVYHHSANLGRYVTLQQVTEEPDLLEEQIGQARKECLAWYRRYRQLDHAVLTMITQQVSDAAAAAAAAGS